MVVVSLQGKAVGSGSGVIVGDRRHVITNFHVVAAGDSYTVILAPPGTARVLTEGVVTDYDESRDLALLKLKDELGSVVQLSDNPPLLGSAITIAGYPGVGGDTLTVTKGAISGFFDKDDGLGDAWIKTDATINHGNSGGAALDNGGRLVGLPTFVIRDGGDSLAYVLSAQEARALIERGLPRTQALQVRKQPTPKPSTVQAPPPIMVAPPVAVQAPAPVGPRPEAQRAARELGAFLDEILAIFKESNGYYSAANNSGAYRTVAPTIRGLADRAAALRTRTSAYSNPAAGTAVCRQAATDTDSAVADLARYLTALAQSFAAFPSTQYEGAKALYGAALDSDFRRACGVATS
jgi:hypothetical protein